MSTEVTYNGITLSFVKTQALDAQPAMDPSGTDQLYTKFVYQCAATFVRAPGAGQGGETPAETYARVRHMLTQPRKPLLIKSNGKTLLACPTGLDANNGPKPLPGIQITRVTDESYAVVWGVEVCLTDCDRRATNSPVLSLRWVQTHDVDECNMSTFVTSGRLSAATDLLRGIPIDALRPLCIPHEPPNCTRRSKYTVQADGTAIDFTFTDTEQYLVPEKDTAKAGVVKVGGTYERIVLGGIVRFVRLTLRMQGKKTTPKRKLMAMCAGMAIARMRAGRPPGGKVFIKEGAFREHEDASVVEIHLNAYAQDLGAIAATATAFQIGFGLATAGLNLIPALIPGAAVMNPAQAGAQPGGAAGNQGNPPAQGPVAPQVGLGLDAFGVRLQGCADPVDEAEGIHPDLRGNYDRLLMIAAALRDPCLSTWPLLVDNQENEAHLKTFPTPGEHKLRTPSDGRLKTPALAAENTSNRPGPVVTLASTLPQSYSLQLQGYTDPYAGIYTEYEATLAYVNDRGGRDVLPATVAKYTGPTLPPSAAYPNGLKYGDSWPGARVQVHNDQVRLQASWTATKVGGTPTVPSWKEPSDGNAVCTDVAVQPEMVEVAADGVSLIHKITGVYEYAYLDTSKVKMHSPLPPWTTLTTGQLPGYPTDESIVFGDPTTSRLVSR